MSPLVSNRQWFCVMVHLAWDANMFLTKLLLIHEVIHCRNHQREDFNNGVVITGIYFRNKKSARRLHTINVAIWTKPLYLNLASVPMSYLNFLQGIVLDLSNSAGILYWSTHDFPWLRLSQHHQQTEMLDRHIRVFASQAKCTVTQNQCLFETKGLSSTSRRLLHWSRRWFI